MGCVDSLIYCGMWLGYLQFAVSPLCMGSIAHDMDPISLLPRPFFAGEEKTAWYNLFAHA